jgi:hypothetical protein
MAAIRKPVKKDTSSPGTALVLFLVFFILLAIGLGVWGYYGYAGQDQLKKTAEAEQGKAKGAQLAADYYGFLARDLLAAQGHNLGTEQDAWIIARTDFMSAGGKFAKEPGYDAFKKTVEANAARLGFTGKAYKTTFGGEVSRLDKDLKKAQADLAQAQSDLADNQKDLALLQVKTDKYWKGVLDEVRKGNEAALTASKQRTQDIEDAFKENQNLVKKMEDTEEKHQEEVRKLNREIQKLNELLKQGDERLVTGPAAKGMEVHALMLDISPGKALWDNPVGKVLTVNQAAREVQINIGSSHGVKPQLTFNVFAKGADGRADGVMKGTIEVVRVLGPSASAARITSLYDVAGREISLSDPTYGRLKRETENAIKEGDLLYNLTFGTHVAIAGAVLWNGGSSGTPAELMRDLHSYIGFLNRQGVAVDAYVDLTDGQIKGRLTSKTRFLVRGYELGSLDQPKGKGDKKEEPKEVKKEEKKPEKIDVKAIEAATPEGLEAVNDSVRSLSKQALERGLFLITPENLAVVTGYRPPRSAASLEVSPFRPTPPMAATPPEVTQPKKDEGKEKKKTNGE